MYITIKHDRVLDTIHVQLSPNCLAEPSCISIKYVSKPIMTKLADMHAHLSLGYFPIL